MIKRKTAAALALLMLSALLGGCWNYVDVDAQLVVMGAIIDKEDDEYVMIAEVSKAKGGAEAELTTRIEEAKGTTLFDATRNSILKIGAKPYWGHMMVYIVSEKVARESIAEVLSLLSRQTQIRSDIFIMVCTDDAADKIFTFEDPIHEDVSQHLHDLLETYEASGKVRRSPLFMVLQELASDEISLMLPVITMQQEETEQKETQTQPQKDEQGGQPDKQAEEIVIAEGSAIFAKDKMAAKLDNIQTRSALIIKQEIIKNFVIAVPETQSSPACAIEVIDSTLNITPRETKKGNVHYDIKLDLEGDLVELISEKDYISNKSIGKLEAVFEKILRKELLDAIAVSQEAESDICGFAGVLHRKLPDVYRKVKKDWPGAFKRATFAARVSVRISSSSLSMNPIKVGQ